MPGDSHLKGRNAFKNACIAKTRTLKRVYSLRDSRKIVLTINEFNSYRTYRYKTVFYVVLLKREFKQKRV